MKLSLPAKTARGAAALADASAALLKYMEAEADVANFDDGQGNVAGMVVDKIRLKLVSDPDDDDASKDKHDALLTVTLKPGKKGRPSRGHTAPTA